MNLQRLFAWRIPRRIVTIGFVLIAVVVITALCPLWIVGALIADAVQDWRRHRWVRLLAIIALYFFNELWGIIGLLLLWIAFAWNVNSPASYRWHGHLLGVWTHILFWGVDKILLGRIEIRNADAVKPAPVVVLARHISFLDAIVPAVLVAWKRPNMPRHVVMKELRWAPCIDILGHRTPNHFVDRASGGKAEVEAIRRVGRTADGYGSLIIFPEGGFRTPARFTKAVNRLERSDPHLADRARALRHVLPPRPRGSLALLNGAEGVDVVVVAHAGFEKFNSLKNIFANVPIERPIVVELKRISRDQIPMEPDAFQDWLLAQYEWIDAFVDKELAALPADLNLRSPAPATKTVSELKSDRAARLGSYD